MRNQTICSLFLCLVFVSEASDDCTACKEQCNSHCTNHCPLGASGEDVLHKMEVADPDGQTIALNIFARDFADPATAVKKFCDLQLGHGRRGPTVGAWEAWAVDTCTQDIMRNLAPTLDRLRGHCSTECETLCSSRCMESCTLHDSTEEHLETGEAFSITNEIYERLNPPAPEQFLPVAFSEAEQQELRIALIFHHSPESRDDVSSLYKDYLFLLRCWAEKNRLDFVLDHTPVDVLPFMENVPVDLTRYRGWWGLFFAIQSHLKHYDGVFVMDSDMLVTYPMWGFDPRNLLRWYTEDILISDQCVRMHASSHAHKIARLHAHSPTCATLSLPLGYKV